MRGFLSETSMDTSVRKRPDRHPAGLTSPIEKRPDLILWPNCSWTECIVGNQIADFDMSLHPIRIHSGLTMSQDFNYRAKFGFDLLRHFKSAIFGCQVNEEAAKKNNFAEREEKVIHWTGQPVKEREFLPKVH